MAFLDYDGLKRFLDKLKEKFVTKDDADFLTEKDITGNGKGSTRLNKTATADGENSVVIGNNAYTYKRTEDVFDVPGVTYKEIDPTDSVVIGNGAFACDYGVSIGSLAKAYTSTSIAIGKNAKTESGGASGLIAIGNDALTSGLNSISVGSSANSDSNAIAIGYNSSAKLQCISIGTDVTNSTYSTTIGYQATSSGSNATAIGYKVNAVAARSVALGSNAKITTTVNGSSGDSTVVGASGQADGIYTTAVGSGVSANNNYATAIGSKASATTVNSTVLGYKATASTGNNATAIGEESSATGTNATSLGQKTTANKNYTTALGQGAYAGAEYATSLGYSASNSVEKSLLLGSTTASYFTAIRSRVTSITSTSDERDKTDIHTLAPSLDFVNKLHPVTYVWNDRESYKYDEETAPTQKIALMAAKPGIHSYDKEAHARGDKKGTERQVGLISQEVKKAMIECFGSDEYMNLVFESPLGISDDPVNQETQMALNYTNLIPVLIKAIQELSDRVELLESEVQNGID